MRTRLASAAAVLVWAGLTLTACATEGSAMPTPGDSPTASRPPFRTASPAPLSPTGSAADLPPAKWSALVADLTSRGISGDPKLISSERVDFSDGSLGCPQPGMAYTQAIVEGYRVVVRADDRTFDYRFGTGDEPRLCER
ncbi:hypothetical protein [Microbacterium oleivorans]|uniref:hypothetical protein n=1 Tax=Microbacterium oleivorans TaxID=273677 RepID=UPI00080DA79F|nr:hypothetical protein [Microbacterium oleivorans]